MGLRQALIRFIQGAPPHGSWGILAQFASPHDVYEAAYALRRKGYRRFDVHSPYPIHGIDRAMGLRRSWVPWLTFGGGVTGCLGALLLQWWINVVNYPLVISGKPYFSLPAFIPVAFEATILLAAFGTIGGMLLFNLLPMFYHPLFKNESFRHATSDGFFISLEARDPRFDAERVPGLLKSLGGYNIALLEP